MKFWLYHDKRLKRPFYKNFIIFSVIIFFTIMLLVFPFSFYLRNLYENQLLDINNDLSTRARDMCDSVISQVQMYTISASTNYEIVAFAAAKNEENHVASVQNYLRFYKYINNYIDSIYILNYRTGNLISDTSVIENSNAITGDINDKLKIYKDDPTIIYTCAKNNKYPFVIRIIRHVSIGDNTIAIIADIDIDKFNGLFESIDSQYTNQIFITTADGKVVYSDGIKERFNMPINEIMRFEGEKEAQFNNKRFLISYKKSERFDFIYYSLLPIEYYRAAIKGYAVVIIMSTFLSVLLGMFVSFFMARRSMSHIELILSEFERGEQMPLRKIPLEIRYIIEDIRASIKKTEDIENEISSRMLMLKIAQVQALQSQINPHFLHNTLDSINWMVFSKMGRDNEVSKCIVELSEMYRLGLQTDAYIIPLYEELGHAEAYCSLLKIRHGESIDIHFNIPENEKNMNVVKFILQPIIENAVYHGVKPKENGGNVWVEAFSENGVLCINVKDDGVGIPAGKLAEINKELECGFGSLDEQIVQIVENWESYETGETKNSAKESWWLGRKKNDVGIGIKNVNNRIKMIFGESYGIKLVSNELAGITVEIRMPIK